MENNEILKSESTLLLTNNVFKILLDRVIGHFEKSHAIEASYKDSQLYGFGNFDSTVPNLKNDLELVLKGYVNGKYLYNKSRELSSGKPIVKISKVYKYLFFNYLGFKDVFDFLEASPLTAIQKTKQLELLSQRGSSENYYYVCYYFGEDDKMNKGQVFLYNDWRTIEMVYVYEGDNEERGVYTFHGTVTQSEDFAYFDTKYFVGNKKSEGAKFIFFIGKSWPNERNYLVGAYSGFDKYSRAIAGKMILKKFNSKAETDAEIASKVFEPVICQELNKNRMVIESNTRKNPLMFSKNSPYAQVLSDSAGTYNFNFLIDNTSYTIKLLIEKYHYNIVSLKEAIFIEDDVVSILSNGQVLNLDFSISGMFFLQKVSIYVKTLDLLANKKETAGSFNGIDINNTIRTGTIKIQLL